jgi:hypothetical protein
MVAFGIGGDGFCVECEDENVSFGDYTLVAVKPPTPPEHDETGPAA